METKHIVFSPVSYPGLSTLAAICSDQEKSGWRLLKVIPHHQYESVAVFERSNIVFTS